jgi:hypothetical protein
MLKVFPLSLSMCQRHDTNYSSIKNFVLVKLIGFYRVVVIQKEGHGSGDEHRGGFGLGNHGIQGKKNNK